MKSVSFSLSFWTYEPIINADKNIRPHRPAIKLYTKSIILSQFSLSQMRSRICGSYIDYESQNDPLTS